MQQAQAKDEWLYGAKAIADFVGVTERTVRRWIADDEPGFPVLRGKGRWFAHSGDLRRWLSRQRREGAG